MLSRSYSWDLNSLSSRKTNIQQRIQNGLEKEDIEGLSCSSWQGLLPLLPPPLLLHPFSWGQLVGSWHTRAQLQVPALLLHLELWHLILSSPDSKKMPGGRKRRCHAQGLQGRLCSRCSLLPSELQPGIIQS